MDLQEAIASLKNALEFCDRVITSSPDEQRAVGNDHWEWLRVAAWNVVHVARSEEKQ